MAVTIVLAAARAEVAMTFMDLEGLDAELLAALEEIDSLLAATAQDLDAVRSGETQRIRDIQRARAIIDLMDDPGIVGLLGTGTWSIDDDSAMQPAIFAWDKLTDQKVAPLSSCSEVLRRLALMRSPDLPSTKILVVGISDPEPQDCGPGRRVEIATEQATLGCRATLSDGRKVVTTAGHAASTGSTAYAGNSLLGTVVHAQDWTSCAPGTAGADVAFIEVDADHPEGAASPFDGYQPGRKKDDVCVKGGETDRYSRIAGQSRNLRVRYSTSGWANVSLTRNRITDDGDSGSPVTLGSDFSTLIGHVVGATNESTVIQDLKVQLDAFNARLRR